MAGVEHLLGTPLCSFSGAPEDIYHKCHQQACRLLILSQVVTTDATIVALTALLQHQAAAVYFHA